MFDLNKEFGFDSAKAEKGAWLDFGSGARILVAMTGTATYRKSVFQKAQKMSAHNRNAVVSYEQNNHLTVEVLVESIVLNWEGIYKDGEMIPFSKKNAIAVLTEYPDLRDRIEAFAGNRENYQHVEDLEDDQKN